MEIHRRACIGKDHSTSEIDLKPKRICNQLVRHLVVNINGVFYLFCCVLFLFCLFVCLFVVVVVVVVAVVVVVVLFCFVFFTVHIVHFTSRVKVTVSFR